MKQLILSPKAGERVFKGKALRRCIGSKELTLRGHPGCNTTVPAPGLDSSQGQGLSQCTWSGQHRSTKPTDLLISVLPLTFMREALRTYC